MRAIIWAAVSTRPQAEDEKFSIPRQIEDAEMVCYEKGWTIVDRLIVSGHSRNYRDLHTLAHDARKAGIDAFEKLIAHMERRDFDVIICRDANRFARRASLLHWLVEMLIEECGAAIYSLQDHLWVDEDNADMWATMKGYTSRVEIKWLVKATKAGLQRRVERGLTTTKVPFSHKIVYNESRKPEKLVVDESKRRLFNAVFEIVVEQQCAWSNIEKRLASDYGIYWDDGQPYGEGTMFKMLHRPITWGGASGGRASRGVNNKIQWDYGTWTFDPSVQPPASVSIIWGAVEPVYTGEQSERMRAELWRRKNVKGKRPRVRQAFSGLIVCGECGLCFVCRGNRSHVTGNLIITCMGCNRASFKPRSEGKCRNAKTIKMEYVKDYINRLLYMMIDSDSIDVAAEGIAPENVNISLLQKEIEEAERRLSNLIRLQVQAHAAAQSAYQVQINETAQQIETLKAALKTQEYRDTQSAQRKQASQKALNAIRDIIDTFWVLPSPTINQHLHRLFGNRRLVALNGSIVGFTVSKPLKLSARNHK